MEVLEGMREGQLKPVVIILTNYGQAQYRKKCLESGATFFFDKSSEFEKVADVLQRLVKYALASGGIGNGRVGHVKEGSGNPSGTQIGDGGPAQQEGTTTAERPRLLVSRSSEGEPIYYMCSYCLRGFPLPDIQPQKEAARELYRSFREHVERKHPESNDGPTTASAA
jgi:hypothetical protein